MATPVQAFFDEIFEINGMDYQLLKMVIPNQVLNKHIQDEKKFIIDTYNTAITNYRKSITDDTMHQNGEEYYDSISE
jgi:3-isopropylmalate dehydratase small subunit